MPIEFVRDVQRASFYSPLEDFAPVEVEVEVREDPLTGRQARIVPESFVHPGEFDIEEVVRDDENCFFCPGTVEEVTPKYPDWVGEERVTEGEATSFPNLNPYGAHSNVVALTEDHYRPIDGFTPEVFEDGLRAALRYVTAVRDHEDAPHASVNMNFLRPAGSSIIHPHLQTLVDDRGTNVQRELREADRAYREEHGADYWADLTDEERDGERFVAETSGVSWLAPFAPRHHRHLVGVATGAEGVPAPESDLLADLASGIASVLSYYGDAGLNSFNFALFLDEGATPVFDVVARSVFDRYYWSDSPFFTVLHDEGVVDVAPETYAAEARGHF
ncbi:hypothetical protein [Halomarina pelagica]|uniref:hypothetical protein n=1 Tax=Halomarina pelagica TaxID=2961599 RepID=UPI0020C46BE2|nr:hypothetical protein [Halomarina sp. BND7]